MNPLRFTRREEKEPPKGVFIPFTKGKDHVPLRPRADGRTAKEVALDDGKAATQKIKIQVQSVVGHDSGTYTLRWERDRSLEHYFSKLGLKMAAIKNRVYDRSCMERGPLRLTYCPTSESDILISGHSGGSAYAHQRAATTGEQAARMMSSRGDKEIIIEAEKPARSIYRMRNARPSVLGVEEL